MEKPSLSNFTATAGDKSITLAWDVYVVAGGISSVTIKRSTTKDGTYTWLTEKYIINSFTGTLSQTFVDTKVQNDVTYYYLATYETDSLGVSATPFGPVKDPPADNMFAFAVGLDNIFIGGSTFEDSSVYVSALLPTSANAHIGLTSTETRPYWNRTTNSPISSTGSTYNIASGLEQNYLFLGSIEYWITKQNYDINGDSLGQVTFPILPLDVTRINHERIFPSAASGIAPLMFYTTLANGDISICRNGLILTYGDTSAGWALASGVTSANTGSPMKTNIKLYSVAPGDFFTASYNPLVSDLMSIPTQVSGFSQLVSGLNIIDLAGDMSVRQIEKNIIAIDAIGKAAHVDTCKLYLSIILRNNGTDTSTTPTVSEFKLFTSAENQSPFEV